MLDYKYVSEISTKKPDKLTKNYTNIFSKYYCAKITKYQISCSPYTFAAGKQLHSIQYNKVCMRPIPSPQIHLISSPLTQPRVVHPTNRRHADHKLYSHRDRVCMNNCHNPRMPPRYHHENPVALSWANRRIHDRCRYRHRVSPRVYSR